LNNICLENPATASSVYDDGPKLGLLNDADRESSKRTVSHGLDEAYNQSKNEIIALFVMPRAFVFLQCFIMSPSLLFPSMLPDG